MQAFPGVVVVEDLTNLDVEDRIDLQVGGLASCLREGKHPDRRVGKFLREAGSGGDRGSPLRQHVVHQGDIGSGHSIFYHETVVVFRNGGSEIGLGDQGHLPHGGAAFQAGHDAPEVKGGELCRDLVRRP